jgi:hypothetical protein
MLRRAFISIAIAFAIGCLIFAGALLWSLRTGDGECIAGGTLGLTPDSEIDVSINTWQQYVYLIASRSVSSMRTTSPPVRFHGRIGGEPGFPVRGSSRAGTLETVYSLPNPFVPDWHGIGYSVDRDQWGWVRSAKAPRWLIISLLLLPGIVCAIRLFAQRRRKPGICARCGYDLRATPDQCPECGRFAERPI